VEMITKIRSMPKSSWKATCCLKYLHAQALFFLAFDELLDSEELSSSTSTASYITGTDLHLNFSFCS